MSAQTATHLFIVKGQHCNLNTEGLVQNNDLIHSHLCIKRKANNVSAIGLPPLIHISFLNHQNLQFKKFYLLAKIINRFTIRLDVSSNFFIWHYQSSIYLKALIGRETGLASQTLPLNPLTI